MNGNKKANLYKIEMNALFICARAIQCEFSLATFNSVLTKPKILSNNVSHKN